MKGLYLFLGGIIFSITTLVMCDLLFGMGFFLRKESEILISRQAILFESKNISFVLPAGATVAVVSDDHGVLAVSVLLVTERKDAFGLSSETGSNVYYSAKK